MTPSNLLTWLIVLTVSFFLIVFGIDKSMPFQKRVNFLSVCDNYNQIAIKQGYLKSTDIDDMTEDLAEKGITISVLTVPQSKLEWGTSFVFKVEAIYSQNELKMDYNKEIKPYTFNYFKKSTALCEE